MSAGPMDPLIPGCRGGAFYSTVVPLPAAVWLIGLAFLGHLGIGFARRDAAARGSRRASCEEGPARRPGPVCSWLTGAGRAAG